MVSLAQVDRGQNSATFTFVITKISTEPPPAKQDPTLNMVVTDDHGSDYKQALTYVPQGSPAEFVSNLPVGFQYKISASLPVPRAAPIMKLRIGVSTSLADVDLSKQARLLPMKDFGNASLSPGGSLTVTRFQKFSFGAISPGIYNWYIPVKIENSDYNDGPPVAVQVLSQRGDGEVFVLPSQDIPTVRGLASSVISVPVPRILAGQPFDQTFLFFFKDKTTGSQIIRFWSAKSSDFPPRVGQGAGAGESLFVDAYQKSGGQAEIGDPAGLPRWLNGGETSAGPDDLWVQDFPNAQGGEAAIVAVKGRGAFLIPAGFWGTYQKDGGPKTFGLPESKLQKVTSSKGTQGEMQTFERATLVRLIKDGKPGEIYSVTGPIRETWIQLKQAEGPLGIPVAAQQTGSQDFMVQRFEGGAVYGHSRGGFQGKAFAVFSPALEGYEKLGGGVSWLGLPTTDINVQGGKFQLGFAYAKGKSTLFFPPVRPKFVSSYVAGTLPDPSQIRSTAMDEKYLYFLSYGGLYVVNRSLDARPQVLKASSDTSLMSMAVGGEVIVILNQYHFNYNVEAYDRNNISRKLWGGIQLKFNPYSHSEISATKEIVAILDGVEDKLYVHDLKTGIRKWTANVPQGSFVVAEQSAVYVSTGQQGSARLSYPYIYGITAFRAADGVVQWSQKREMIATGEVPFYWSPLGISASKDSVLRMATHPFEELSRYSPSGKLLWRIKYSGKYVADARLEKDPIFFATTSGVYAFDETTGNSIWKLERTLPETATMAVSSNQVFVSTDEEVLVLDKSKGSILSRFPIPGPAKLEASADTLYVASGGYLAAFDASDSSADSRKTGTNALSVAGLRFIAQHEGSRTTPSGQHYLYDDPADHCTIGYGHLIHRGKCNGTEPEEFQRSGGISEQRALELLKADAAVAERAVSTAVTVPMNQAQFDALVSFVYNLGEGNLRQSDLLKKLNAGDYDAVPEELNRWVFAGEQKLAGLVERRRNEGVLFKEGRY